ncbi:MAG: MBL fold metallo-hydrolase, partial [Rhodospirillaceae bacterium]|nr:MBL fold metallo-hydrolase [Rhodospirillaceae bacterium]
ARGEVSPAVLPTTGTPPGAEKKVGGRTRAPTAIHRDDAAHAQGEGAEIDEDLVIGDTVGPLEVVDASGKSPGEVAFYWPERRTLIVGDAVIGNPPGACALLPDRVVDDCRRLQENVRRLLEFDVDTLLVGDGVSILTGARDRLAALVKSFDT